MNTAVTPQVEQDYQALHNAAHNPKHEIYLVNARRNQFGEEFMGRVGPGNAIYIPADNLGSIAAREYAMIHRGHEKSVGSSTQKRDGVHFGYTRDPNAKTRLDLELHATSPDNAVATIKSRFQHGRERTVKGPRAITLGAAAARRVGLIE